jgi:glycosyltransferase involved in cell wall biosynthesis
MPHRNCNILSIAPYRILPPSSGGHLGIVYVHHYLGKLCQDHVVSTVDNSSADDYAFQLYKVFPNTPQRYLPFYKYNELLGIARKYDVNYIYCDHPYMAPTAMALSRKLKIPWFLRSHNIEAERFRAFGKKWWPVMRAFERFAMRNANGNFFITPEDKDWAEQHYKLRPSTCHLVPYGTTLDQAPAGHEAAKKSIATSLKINGDVPWLYFLGALDYLPNVQAVEYILDEVMPRLNKTGVAYQIIVAGKGLNEYLKKRIADTHNILYTGFIDDLTQLLKACDIMLNPVILGGGIKTKAIEALGYNKIVISAHSGAAGLAKEACGDNLLVTADHDWDAFAGDVIRAINATPNIPKAFYKMYYWGNIAKNILAILKEYRG